MSRGAATQWEVLQQTEHFLTVWDRIVHQVVVLASAVGSYSGIPQALIFLQQALYMVVPFSQMAGASLVHRYLPDCSLLLLGDICIYLPTIDRTVIPRLFVIPRLQ